MVETIDYVICPICGRHMRMITTGHLKLHSMTRSEFMANFSKQIMQCEKRRLLCSMISKGKIPTFEVRNKIRKTLLGRKHSEEHKRKNRDAQKKVFHYKEWGDAISKALMGKTLSEAHCRAISLGKIGVSYEKIFGAEKAIEVRKKQRIATSRYVEFNNNIKFPAYNKVSCEYFKFYCLENSITDARYAVYGGGEYLVQELGYWLDFISFDKKLIIEWDEDHHYNFDGSLCEKDVRRQEELMSLYPDFIFVRIKHEDGTRILQSLKSRIKKLIRVH